MYPPVGLIGPFSASNAVLRLSAECCSAADSRCCRVVYACCHPGIIHEAIAIVKPENRSVIAEHRTPPRLGGLLEPPPLLSRLHPRNPPISVLRLVGISPLHAGQSTKRGDFPTHMCSNPYSDQAQPAIFHRLGRELGATGNIPPIIGTCQGKLSAELASW